MNEAPGDPNHVTEERALQRPRRRGGGQPSPRRRQPVQRSPRDHRGLVPSQGMGTAARKTAGDVRAAAGLLCGSCESPSLPLSDPRQTKMAQRPLHSPSAASSADTCRDKPRGPGAPSASERSPVGEPGLRRQQLGDHESRGPDSQGEDRLKAADRWSDSTLSTGSLGASPPRVLPDPAGNRPESWASPPIPNPQQT